VAETVLVRNACTTPLRWVPWQRAVCAVVTDQAEIVVADESRHVRSAYLSLPWPLEVQLHAYVHIPYVGAGGDPVDRATRRSILHRDKNSCGYCGGAATTIDHIFPRSRGGLDTWDNLISACVACNQRKRNRTPEESGMKMLWPARAVDLRTVDRTANPLRRAS
jgi:5-methylcytosine-specific restriction endonuclease McrA